MTTPAPRTSPGDVDPAATGRTRRFDPLTDLLRTEAAAGILLVAAAVVALVWANSGWFESYEDLWGTDLTIRLGDDALSLTLREWINDGAMTLFFFVVGLEIKRELTQGELREPRQAALPIVAALGGMIVPAAIYLALNAGGDGSRGWGIPMATDIAIVSGVIALLGRRVPSWLGLFLLALAIVDDIGAILVIAIFYSAGVGLGWLALAIGALAVAAAIRRHVPYTAVYVALGAVSWFGLHEAHVHPTLAGVAFGLLAPVTPSRDDRDVSVVESLEHRLAPVSAFLVVPLFALANAGVRVPASELGDAFGAATTWGVVLGLVVGKPLGIAGATLLAVRLGLGRLPAGVTVRYIVGAGALGGIGFTVSLFVAELAFGDGDLGRDARLGVLVASLAAAALGTLICLPSRHDEDAPHDAITLEAPPA